MGTDSKINLSGIPASNAGQLKVSDLSICIVTYQAQDWLQVCLESLYENTRLSGLEIIVVDNGSEDGINEMLAKNFPEVNFIGNETNEGYTRPMNQSLQAAQGRYLMQLEINWGKY